MSLITGVIFGLAPALEGSGLALSETLKQAGRGVDRRRCVLAGIRRVLITAEVALSLVLVIGAGLLIKSFARLLSRQSRIPRGKADHRSHLALRANVPGYSACRRVLFRDCLIVCGHCRASLSASVVSQLPLTGGPGGDPFSIEGRPYDSNSRTPQITNHQVIGPDYFRTMQIPLLAGRIFRDREPQPAVIINQTMARGFWPGALPKPSAGAFCWAPHGPVRPG